MKDRIRIMMVDDDEDNLQLCSSILARQEYEVYTAASCEKLFEKISAHKPQIIIMDNQLGEMNGSEAIPLLKAHAEYKTIPVILFSSSNDLEHLAKDVGADASLQKPCNVNDLLKIVKLFNTYIH